MLCEVDSGSMVSFTRLSNKAYKEYFLVIKFILMRKVVLTFGCVDEIRYVVTI